MLIIFLLYKLKLKVCFIKARIHVKPNNKKKAKLYNVVKLLL